MDYSKQGGVKPGRNAPKHAAHGARGKPSTGQAASKADLLRRLKEAAQKPKPAKNPEG